MNWQERGKTGFTITCGDGKKYTPLWVVASTQKGIEYNIATFEFKELAGTLVERGEPKGARYPIEIHFQGENHLDIARDFEISARDKRPWTISHPYYDNILVQPVGLNIDNTIENISKITSLVIETISTNSNVVVISAPDKIIEDKAAADASLGESFAKDVPSPQTQDKISIQENLDNIYNTVSTTIQDNTDFSDFFNKYNEASSLLNDGESDSLNIISQVQEFISLPVTFADTLENRVNIFVEQLAMIGAALSNLTLAEKKLYENNGGTIIGCMIAASVTNIGSAYDNRNGVLTIIGIILDSYNTYVANLDSLQTANGGGVLSYIPNPDALTKVSQLVSYAVNALLDIANNSKQERIILLEENSNVILLANRFYGLIQDDSTIEYFIKTNNIQNDSIFEIKKGTRILYYI